MSLYCPTCHEYMGVRQHRCKQRQRWKVTDSLRDGKLDFEWCAAMLIFADDAQEAAEKFCKQADEGGDYTFITYGECERVYVQPEGGGDVTVWHVTAEDEPVYTASGVDDEIPQVVGDEEEDPTAGTCSNCNEDEGDCCCPPDPEI